MSENSNNKSDSNINRFTSDFEQMSDSEEQKALVKVSSSNQRCLVSINFKKERPNKPRLVVNLDIWNKLSFNASYLKF